MFEFDRIEADILGFKVPLPMFNSDAGFVEVQVRALALNESMNPSARRSFVADSLVLFWYGVYHAR